MRLAIALAFACALAAPPAARAALAPLPEVSVEGQDKSGNGPDPRAKVLAGASGASGAGVRVPGAEERRATAENGASLLVNVTPTTLQSPPPPPETRLPFTRLTAGYFPMTMGRVGLLDVRELAPGALLDTELAGRSGLGFWDARGTLALAAGALGRGRLGLAGLGWQAAPALAGQAGEATLDLDWGTDEGGLTGTLFGSASSLFASAPADALRAGASGRARLLADGFQTLTLEATAQARQWGANRGPEGYARLDDRLALGEAFALEVGLGGGWWGFEPILDPRLALDWRPAPGTDVRLEGRARTDLPDFDALLWRPAVAGNAALAAERHAGLGSFRLQQRFGEHLWGAATLTGSQLLRAIVLTDAAGSGLWTPVNLGAPQLAASARLELKRQAEDPWAPALAYEADTLQPYGQTRQRAEATLEGSFLDGRLGVGAGLAGKLDALAGAQTLAGVSRTGSGLFAGASLRYALTDALTLAFAASDVPLALNQPAANYYAPLPILTVHALYQF